MADPTKDEVARYLADRGLMVAPRHQSVTVGAAARPRMPAPSSGGGGGAAFTGVEAGTYQFGNGSITINGKGQVTAITPNTDEDGTYDYRDTTANSGNSFVPTGTSATAHALRVPEVSLLSTFFIWGVIAPGVGESVAIRLFRFTPTTLQQVTTTFVLTSANFVVSTKIDLSSLILPIAFNPDDILACSYVHSGPQTLQPLLTGWTFAPPPALTVLSNPASLPMTWPPS